MDLFDVTAHNRTGWNQIAPRRPGRPAAYFRDGGGVLEPYEIDLAGDVTGRRVLQIACSTGDEVLSWANLGADAIGIDISDVAIGNAQAKAAEAGIVADFRRADMYALPPDLVDLDLVYFSWGAICWAPDLDRLAGLIAGRLRPGGSVLLAEHHPLWEVLGVAGENHLLVNGDYFGRTTPDEDNDDDKRPTGARGEADAPALTSFVWPVADVITAFIGAGLRIDAFREMAEPDMYRRLGATAACLPSIYVIKATRLH
jgi:SAM-dependent methyltransferase